jgi:hypothetical protein
MVSSTYFGHCYPLLRIKNYNNVYYYYYYYYYLYTHFENCLRQSSDIKASNSSNFFVFSFTD